MTSDGGQLESVNRNSVFKIEEETLSARADIDTNVSTIPVSQASTVRDSDILEWSTMIGMPETRQQSVEIANQGRIAMLDEDNIARTSGQSPINRVTLAERLRQRRKLHHAYNIPTISLNKIGSEDEPTAHDRLDHPGVRETHNEINTRSLVTINMPDANDALTDTESTSDLSEVDTSDDDDFNIDAPDFEVSHRTAELSTTLFNQTIHRCKQMDGARTPAFRSLFRLTSRAMKDKAKLDNTVREYVKEIMRLRNLVARSSGECEAVERVNSKLQEDTDKLGDEAAELTAKLKWRIKELSSVNRDLASHEVHYERQIADLTGQLDHSNQKKTDHERQLQQLKSYLQKAQLSAEDFVMEQYVGMMKHRDSVVRLPLTHQTVNLEQELEEPSQVSSEKMSVTTSLSPRVPFEHNGEEPLEKGYTDSVPQTASSAVSNATRSQARNRSGRSFMGSPLDRHTNRMDQSSQKRIRKDSGITLDGEVQAQNTVEMQQLALPNVSNGTKLSNQNYGDQPVQGSGRKFTPDGSSTTRKHAASVHKMKSRSISLHTLPVDKPKRLQFRKTRKQSSISSLIMQSIVDKLDTMQQLTTVSGDQAFLQDPTDEEILYEGQEALSKLEGKTIENSQFTSENNSDECLTNLTKIMHEQDEDGSAGRNTQELSECTHAATKKPSIGMENMSETNTKAEKATNTDAKLDGITKSPQTFDTSGGPETNKAKESEANTNEILETEAGEELKTVRVADSKEEAEQDTNSTAPEAEVMRYVAQIIEVVMTALGTPRLGHNRSNDHSTWLLSMPALPAHFDTITNTLRKRTENKQQLTMQLITMIWWSAMVWLLYATHSLKKQWHYANAIGVRQQVLGWESETWQFQPTLLLQNAVIQAIDRYAMPIAEFT